MRACTLDWVCFSAVGRDKDAKAAARRDQERIEFSVEVLVTRSELDEKKTRMAELEQQVHTQQGNKELRDVCRNEDKGMCDTAGMVGRRQWVLAAGCREGREGCPLLQH